MKLRIPTILACIAFLSGCSTLSEKECRSADWHRLGIKDGLAGEPTTLLEDHRDSCKEYGIKPDDDRYLAGREIGLKEYCRLDNAFRLGLKGDKYQGVCSPDVDMDFRRNNEAALDVYNLKKKIEDIDSQSARKEHELSENETSDKDKQRLRSELRDLDRRRENARNELHYQQRELDRLMDETRYLDSHRRDAR